MWVEVTTSGEGVPGVCGDMFAVLYMDFKDICFIILPMFIARGKERETGTRRGDR